MEYLSSTRLRILLFISTTAVPCFSYPSGPPISSSVWDSMIPQHGFSYQGSTPPYDITVSSTCYKPGYTITVEIVPTDSKPFKGYFVQARNGSSTVGQVQHGTFQIAEDPSQQQILTYFNFKTIQHRYAVSHKTSDLKQKAKFKWTPSPGKQADITFTATIVKNTATFWVRVTSKMVRYDSACGLPIVTMQSSRSTKPTSSSNLATMPSLFLMVFAVACTLVNQKL